MDQEKYEIVKFVDNGFELEVNVSPREETVWLNQEQLCLLFDVDLSRISRHINAIYNSKELEPKGTLAENAIVQKEGNRFVTRTIKMYNLDMIIAVGYRVNSKRGTIFRQWANRILKQYMLRGYAIDSSRVLVTQENYLNLLNVVTDMKSSQLSLEKRIEKLESKYPELNTYVFSCGQMFDATSFLGQIIGTAEKEIVLIDNYIDRGTLDILSHKRKESQLTIITSKEGNRVTPKEYQTFNSQYCNLIIETTNKVHDRFLILDNTEMYHIGASLKDAGRKLFAMDRVKDPGIIRFVLEKTVQPDVRLKV